MSGGGGVGKYPTNKKIFSHIYFGTLRMVFYFHYSDFLLHQNKKKFGFLDQIIDTNKIQTVLIHDKKKTCNSLLVHIAMAFKVNNALGVSKQFLI